MLPVSTALGTTRNVTYLLAVRLLRWCFLRRLLLLPWTRSSFIPALCTFHALLWSGWPLGRPHCLLSRRRHRSITTPHSSFAPPRPQSPPEALCPAALPLPCASWTEPAAARGLSNSKRSTVYCCVLPRAAGWSGRKFESLARSLFGFGARSAGSIACSTAGGGGGGGGRGEDRI